MAFDCPRALGREKTKKNKKPPHLNFYQAITIVGRRGADARPPAPLLESWFYEMNI